MTYWPAGGGRGQNPCRTGLAQRARPVLKLRPAGTLVTILYVPREPICPECPWAVFSGFCPRPPPAGQYVLVFVTLRIEMAPEQFLSSPNYISIFNPVFFFVCRFALFFNPIYLF